MRRTSAGLVVLLAGAPVLLLPMPAQAQERTLRVDLAAWSWRQVAPAGSPVEEPSNVPAGGLAVAYDGRTDAPPAKATYLRLALGGLPAGTTAAHLRLVLPLDPAVEQDATAAPLVACRLAKVFVAGEGVDPATQPAEDCREAARGSYDPATASVSFVLTTAAVEWLGGTPNTGVVIRPDPAAAVPAVLPFQLVFKGPSSVFGVLDATLPPVAEPSPPRPAPAVPLSPEPPSAPGSSGVVPDVFVPLAGPVVPVPSPVAAPSVAVPQTVVAARRPRMTVPARASEAGFATAAALGALLLALVSFASGEAGSPRAFARAERRRLDRVRRPVPAGQPLAREQSRQGRRPLASASSTLTTS